MSVDQRTRRFVDVRPMEAEEVLDELLPHALAQHAELAARGAAVRQVPALGLEVDGTEVTLRVSDRRLVMETGLGHAGVVAHLAADALSDLVQDAQSTMGLAMTARVKLTEGSIDTWIGWEPVLRALLDGWMEETGDFLRGARETVFWPGGETDTELDHAPDC